MARIHNLGFPRIGARRELKFALESYWKGQSSREELTATATALRQRHWAQQAGLDLVPVGDFSFYDQVLDMSFTLGNLPERVRDFRGDQLDNYFRVARGRSAQSAEEHAQCCGGVAAGEMTKWFDTNYHYIVPEFTQDTAFTLNASRLIEQLREAKAQKVAAKPVIIGPLTYLALGKEKDDSNRFDLLARLLPVYLELLNTLAAEGVKWVQIDEPILVTELPSGLDAAFEQAYHALAGAPVKLLLATYFGRLQENLPLVSRLPVAGVHLDAVNAADEVEALAAQLPYDSVLSLGVINGRNIWKTELNATLQWLTPIAAARGERLWVAPSCSLLHVPVDLASEQTLDTEIASWLAFALQKLDELRILGAALNQAATVWPGSLRTIRPPSTVVASRRASPTRPYRPR
ncbi:hypothetical protein UMZ34_03485 [Halopseudomonas pachastrellae]|nr:hypothetical protein UMZ34_03485 [Halopseudomonas pachastrellae]